MGRWIGAWVLSLWMVSTVWGQQYPEYLPPEVARGGQRLPFTPEVSYHGPQWSPHSPQGFQPVDCPRRDFAIPFLNRVEDCCNEGHIWGRVEYLLWAFEGTHLPPLLTESPAGTPQSAAGLLNTPGTRILFGSDTVNNELRSGFRVRVGTWFDESRTLGLEASFLLTESQSNIFQAGSVDGSRVIARPFTNAETGQPDSQLVSFPGVVAGNTVIDAGSSWLLGADVYFREPLCGCCRPCCFRLDALLGYRYFRYDDSLRVQENLRPTSAGFVPGTTITVIDDFRTENSFHGAVLGLAMDYRTGPWSVEVLAKADVGQVYRQVRISGQTRTEVPGVPAVTNQGGLLALSSNIGTDNSNEWTFIPEVDVNIGYNLTSHCRVLVGYSFIYLTNFARAGEQIDTQVNRNLIPPIANNGAGPARPAFTLNRNNLWVQGITFGLECRY